MCRAIFSLAQISFRFDVFRIAYRQLPDIYTVLWRSGHFVTLNIQFCFFFFFNRREISFENTIYWTMQVLNEWVENFCVILWIGVCLCFFSLILFVYTLGVLHEKSKNLNADQIKNQLWLSIFFFRLNTNMTRCKRYIQPPLRNTREHGKKFNNFQLNETWCIVQNHTNMHNLHSNMMIGISSAFSIIFVFFWRYSCLSIYRYFLRKFFSLYKIFVANFSD